MLAWVHTCPPREPLLGKLLQSLHDSDLSEYQVRSCPAKGLGNVEDWFIAQLDELTQKDEWVLRMEDDIIVSPHLAHNVRAWPARRCPYFGIGLLFRFSWYQDDCRHWRVDAATGSRYYRHQHVSGAQMVLYRSEVWPRIRARLPLQRGSLMDLGVTEAVWREGLRTYVHTPSQAQTVEAVSRAHCLHMSGQQDHHAPDFDPDYRRPDGEKQDQVVLRWSGGRVNRFLPRSDGGVLEVQALPGDSGVGFGDSVGRRVLINYDRLLDDEGEARRVAAQRRTG